jgi:CheY-like chemotaxis protein
VEDNPADVELLKIGFRNIAGKFILEVATDGEQALERLRPAKHEGSKPRPDLMLLDLNLPMRSGREVLEIVKADPDLRSMPVVVLTSSKAREDILSSYQSGANSFLQKPSSLDDFLDLVKTIAHYWMDLALLPVSGNTGRGT